jgi:hypothetical protein
MATRMASYPFALSRSGVAAVFIRTSTPSFLLINVYCFPFHPCLSCHGIIFFFKIARLSLNALNEIQDQGNNNEKEQPGHG